MESNVMHAVEVCEYLGISQNNLRQLVFRKVLTPIGREKRRSIYNATDIENYKNSRKPKASE